MLGLLIFFADYLPFKKATATRLSRPEKVSDNLKSMIIFFLSPDALLNHQCRANNRDVAQQPTLAVNRREDYRLIGYPRIIGRAVFQGKISLRQ